MNNSRTMREQLRRHRRDLVLMSRLFDGWSRGRSQRSRDADSRLDAIEAQLARLERTVTMATPALCRAAPAKCRARGGQTTIAFAAYHT